MNRQNSKVVIQTYTTGPLHTNSHALIDPASESMVAIDVGPESASHLLREAKEHKVPIVAIWLTHSHWDHIADIAKLLAFISQSGQTPPEVVIHELDAPNLRDPGSDRIPAPQIKGIIPSRSVDEGDTLCLGTARFRVLHTPGHSPGSIALYCASENVLFSGDTLFHRGLGTLALPTASPRLMPASLLKLAALPPATRIYPGHGQQSTIAEESGWINKRFDTGERPQNIG